MAASFSKDTRGEVHFFLKINNGLGEVPFEGVLLSRIRVQEVNTIRNLDILVIQLASMVSSFSPKLLVHGARLLSLKPRHWQNFNLNF